MHKLLLLLSRNQKGFTLVEVLVAIAITALIGTTISVATTQLFSVSVADKNRMEAIKQVENALHYINRDAQMAQTLSPTDPDNFLVLTWNEWKEGVDTDASGPTGTFHEVTYKNDSGQLKRVEIIKPDPATTETKTNIVANKISDASSCSIANSVLTVSITATTGGFKSVEETRIMEIQPRPE